MQFAPKDELRAFRKKQAARTPAEIAEDDAVFINLFDTLKADGMNIKVIDGKGNILKE